MVQTTVLPVSTVLRTVLQMTRLRPKVLHSWTYTFRILDRR